MSTPSDILALCSRATAALANGRKKEFIQLVEDCPALLTWEDEQGITLLVRIAQLSGSASEVEWLIGLGADPSKKAKDGTSALEMAMMRSSLSDDDSFARCKALIEGGADPNTIMGSGYTALQYAIERGRLDVAELLLKAHAEPSKHSADLPPVSTSEVVARSKNPDAARQLLSRFGKGRPERDL